MEEKNHSDDDILSSGGDSSPNLNEKVKYNKQKKKKSYWAILSTIVTFFLAGIFSLLSSLASTYVYLSIFLLIFLIFINIAFDGIGVAVTAAELAPFLSMASRRSPGSRMAVKLVKNAEKVSNICSDIIGDICGIVSGACGMSLIYGLLKNASNTLEFWIVILFSSFISALTVGGKAFMKNVAIKNSKTIIIGVSRLLSVFSKDPREKREREKEKEKKFNEKHYKEESEE